MTIKRLVLLLVLGLFVPATVFGQKVAEMATYVDKLFPDRVETYAITGDVTSNKIIVGGLPGVEGYFPQFAAGDIYCTMILVRNKNADRRQVSVDWVGPNGQPVQLRAVERDTNTYGFAVNLAPADPAYLGTKTTLCAVDGKLKTGATKVVQPVDQWGIPETEVLVTIQEIGSVLKDVTRPLEPSKADRKTSTFGAEHFGIAVNNTTNETALVFFTRESGEKTSVTLPPQGQISIFVGQLFPRMEKGAESERLAIDSNVPVGVILLEVKRDPKDGITKFYQVDAAMPPQKD